MNESEEPPLKEDLCKQEKVTGNKSNKPNPCRRQPDMGLYNYWRHAVGLLPNWGGICTVIHGGHR